MSDVLSQSEIDALLNAINSGDIETETEKAGSSEPQARDYDFRTANRFHKEQIRTLRIIHETFSRLFSSYLSGTLRVMCNIEVMSVEELKYAEFINALPEPVILGVLRQQPLAGPVLFEISPDISYAMISRLLGGVPSAGNTARAFTEIELVLVERMIRQFLPLFTESWEKVVDVSTNLDRIETSPQFVQIVAGNETVAIVTLNATIGSVTGLISICLPHIALEPVSKSLSTKFIYQTMSDLRHSDTASENIQSRLERTPMSITAVFNDTATTVRDILNLQKGDVIQLDHKIEDPILLKVAHLPKFRGKLGVRENRYAIKIAETIHKEEDE